MSDAERIEFGIRIAQEFEQPIDSDTARAIAAQLHDGQWSALYSLASTGMIDYEPLAQDIERDLEDEQLDLEAHVWLRALSAYVEQHSPRKAYEEFRGEPATDEEYEEAYQGHWSSETEYAEEYLDSMGVYIEVDKLKKELGFIGNYLDVDTQALMRDWQLGGDIYLRRRTDGSIDVFYTI
jgi:hypothetical protein